MMKATAVLAFFFVTLCGFSTAWGQTVDWTRQLGTSSGDRSNGVSADGLGNVYISGITSGTLSGGYFDTKVDPFVSKFDANGNRLWIQQFGTGESDEVLGVSANGLGNVYVSGVTHGSLGGPNEGAGDVIVSKFDESGSLVWIRQFGTSLGEQSNGISADGLGNIYVSGSTQGSLDGPKAGEYDAFVSKFDEDGDLEWIR